MPSKLTDLPTCQRPASPERRRVIQGVGAVATLLAARAAFQPGLIPLDTYNKAGLAAIEMEDNYAMANAGSVADAPDVEGREEHLREQMGDDS